MLNKTSELYTTEIMTKVRYKSDKDRMAKGRKLSCFIPQTLWPAVAGPSWPAELFNKLI